MLAAQSKGSGADGSITQHPPTRSHLADTAVSCVLPTSEVDDDEQREAEESFGGSALGHPAGNHNLDGGDYGTGAAAVAPGSPTRTHGGLATYK